MRMSKESVISIYNNSFGVELKRPFNKPMTYTRFCLCNAYIADECLEVKDDTDNTYHTIRMIKSYDTKVAFYDYTTKCFCEIGKFSRTTSKQCTRIFNRYYKGDRVNAMHYHW